MHKCASIKLHLKKKSKMYKNMYNKNIFVLKINSRLHGAL